MTITFFVSEYLPKKSARPIFFIAFLINSGIHVRRMIVSWGIPEIDSSILSMQMTIKITYAAYAVADFHSKSKREDTIHRLPTLLEWLGYGFGFMGILGPATNLKDYLMFVERAGNYSNVKSSFRKHVKSVGSLLLYVVIYFAGVLLNFNSSPFTDSERIANWNIFTKFIVMNISAINIRAQYVLVWMIGQLSVDAAGLSYSEETQLFNRHENVYIFQFESKLDPKSRAKVRTSSL